MLRIFMFCLIIVFVVQPAGSQVIVVRSAKKTVIDGKSFYLHTVKPGETLYSISKAYSVLQKDVVFSNPDAFEGIKAGQELKIPVESGQTPTGSQLQSAQFIYHITEKGQTVYWLTQQYNITQEELFQYNPELEHSSLQTGQVVTIPKKTNGERTTAQPKVAYVVHTVKRGETLFSISRSYNADLNQVYDLNPDINPKVPNVRLGQEIKIPVPKAAPIGLPVETSKTDTIIIRQDILETQNTTSQDEQTQDLASQHNCVQTSQNEFRIALLLPLFLADNSPASAPDSAVTRDSEGYFRYRDSRYWIHPRSANALDFYQGALLAIDSLKKLGLNLQLVVFDTMRDTEKMEQILRSPEMKNMDLIIGPFNVELVDQAASFARENGIYYVSPTSINATSLKNNPYLLMVNSGEINTVAPMVEHISKHKNIHVTLIGNNWETDQTLYNAYLNKLKTVFADSCLTSLQMNPENLQEFSRFLKKDRMNVVIVPSAEETFVNLIAGRLNTSSSVYQINLYGLASWTKFVDLDPEYLHTLEFRYATPFYVDYNQPPVRYFLQQFRKNYYTEPTMLTRFDRISPLPYQFAFLGYDVTFYFVSAVKKYGKDFGRCIPYFRMPVLQSDFRFEKVDPLSGYKNTNFDIYKYGKDYTITKD